MSKKPSENQKSGSKIPESYFRSSNTETTSREDSLERRLFALIRNELRRTTAQNEFATLENRIIRILRNEFVNDIMMEINTSNDEIATFFNRFLRSVPELSELGNRVRSERAAKEGENGERSSKGEGAKYMMQRGERYDNNRKQTFTGNLDETNLGVILEMFRAPIQVTCRACEDMRRIIRSGRRMIREIQLIAAIRSDLHALRRIEMKCVEELDHVRTLRYRRQVNSIGNWRQIFRRRWRNIQPSPVRDRGYYYVIFDRPNKPRILPRMILKSTHKMIIRFKKRGTIMTCRTTPDKHNVNWNEVSAKAEINRMIQTIRNMRWGSIVNSLETTGSTLSNEVSVLPQIDVSTSLLDTQYNSLTSSIFPRNSENAEGGTNPTAIAPDEETNLDEPSTTMEYEGAHIGPTAAQRTQSTPTEQTLHLPRDAGDNSSGARSPQTVVSPDRSSPPPAPSAAAPIFTVFLRVGSAAPHDVTVLLYSDRVLAASVAQRSRAGGGGGGGGGGGWSGWLQRRWVLPDHVDVEQLRCFLRNGTLVITASSLPLDASFPLGPDFTPLGAPERKSFPYPRRL